MVTQSLGVSMNFGDLRSLIHEPSPQPRYIIEMWRDMGCPQDLLPYIHQHIGPLPSQEFLQSLTQEIPLKAMWLLITQQEPESPLLPHFRALFGIEDRTQYTEDHAWLRAKSIGFGVDLVGSASFGMYVYKTPSEVGKGLWCHQFQAGDPYSEVKETFLMFKTKLSS